MSDRTPPAGVGSVPVGDGPAKQDRGCSLALLGWTLGWLSGAVSAAVAAKGWEWFVADTFGVVELSVVQAWGLIGVIRLAITVLDLPDEHRRPATAVDVVVLVVTSLLLSAAVFASLIVLVQFR